MCKEFLQDLFGCVVAGTVCWDGVEDLGSVVYLLKLFVFGSDVVPSRLSDVWLVWFGLLCVGVNGILFLNSGKAFGELFLNVLLMFVDVGV